MESESAVHHHAPSPDNMESFKQYFAQMLKETKRANKDMLEEMKSTNASMQSTNKDMLEEMKSTNASMQTMNASMQTMNASMQNMNASMQNMNASMQTMNQNMERLSENVTRNFPDPIVQAAQNYIKIPCKGIFNKLIEQLQKLRQENKATFDDSFAKQFLCTFNMKSGQLKEFNPTVAELLGSVAKSSAESVQMSKFKGVKNYFWRVYSAAVPCIDLKQDASDGSDHPNGSKHAGTNLTSENDGDDEDSQESQNKSQTTVKTKTPPVTDLAAIHILFEAAIIAVASESPEGKIAEHSHFTGLWEHYITEVVEHHEEAKSPQLFHFATADDNLDYFDADDQKIGASGNDDAQDLAETGEAAEYENADDEIGTSGKDDAQDLAETGEAAEFENADDEVASGPLPVEIISVASTAVQTESSQLELVFYPFKHYSPSELKDACKEDRVAVWVDKARKGRKNNVAIFGKTDLIAKRTKYAIELKRFQYHFHSDHQSVHSNALLQACWESQALLQQNDDTLLEEVAASRKQMMALQKKIEDLCVTDSHRKLRGFSEKDDQRATHQKSLAVMKENHKQMVAQIATAVVLVTDGIFSNLVISPEPRVIIITERAKDEVERRAMVDYWCQGAIAFKKGKPLALPRVGKGGFAKLLENYFTDPNPADESISADESNPGATTGVTTPMMSDDTQAGRSLSKKKRPTNTKDKSQRNKRKKR